MGIFKGLKTITMEESNYDLVRGMARAEEKILLMEAEVQADNQFVACTFAPFPILFLIDRCF